MCEGEAKQMPWFWLLRAKRWVQSPPSMGRVRLGLAVVAVCAAIVVSERMGLWPDALTLDRVPRWFR